MNSPLAPGIDVQSLRRDFPLLGQPGPGGLPLVYLDNGATSH